MCRRRKSTRFVVSSFASTINIDLDIQACGIDLAVKHEGQYIILVVPSPNMGQSQIEANILAYFSNIDIFALERQPAFTTGTLRWVLEFDEVDMAWTVGFMKQGWFHVSLFAGRPVINGH